MERDIFYRDQEGRLLQLLDRAVMNENGRKVVLYQELYGVYARKAEYEDIFLEEMTETGEPVPKPPSVRERESGEEKRETCGGTSQELLMSFLDARSYREKLEILYRMKDCITDYLIDTIAISLDLEIPQGIPEDRYQKLIRDLRTLIRYETGRIR